MEKIVYVTGNRGKYLATKEIFGKENIDIDYYTCDFDELDVNDIELISKDKVRRAYEILKRPCFVTDCGFYIEDYPDNPGYPGAFAKRSGISDNIEYLLEVMKDVSNRKCKFMECLTFYDGKDYYTFYGVSEGTLATEIKGESKERELSRLWHVFIPKNETKTLSEMSDDERNNRKDNHTSSKEEFLKWYKDNI